MNDSKLKSVKDKKSQIEIMGLVIIIVLVTLGVYIFLVFSSRLESDDYKTPTNDKLAQNFLLSLLDTELDCSGFSQSVQEIIVACQTNSGLDCGGVSACIKLNETINSIRNKTLDKWGKTYRITIKSPAYIYENNYVNCRERGRIASQPIPITDSGAYTEITLSICE